MVYNIYYIVMFPEYSISWSDLTHLNHITFMKRTCQEYIIKQTYIILAPYKISLMLIRLELDIVSKDPWILMSIYYNFYSAEVSHSLDNLTVA